MGRRLTARACALLVLWNLLPTVTVRPAVAQVTEAPCEMVLTAPRSANAEDTAMPSTHRFLKAYPGIEYQVQIQVSCGVFPYTFVLNGEPSGMVVKNADPDAMETCVPTFTVPGGATYTQVQCGAISGWIPADVNADSMPEVCVTDAIGTELCASWSIDATTTGFYFVDTDDGTDASGNPSDGSRTPCSMSCGTGTEANPWKTLEDAYENSAADGILYMYGGTYTRGGVTVSGSCSFSPVIPSYAIRWHSQSRVISFLAVPGDSTPIIDHQFDGSFDECSTDPANHNSPPMWTIVGGGSYIDGLEFRNCHVKCVEYEAAGNNPLEGVIVRRTTADRVGPMTVSGSNTSAFMTNTTGASSSCATDKFGSYVGDVLIENIQSGSEGIKFYAECRAVVERVTITANAAYGGDGMIAFKGGFSFYGELRASRCIGVIGNCLGGNFFVWRNTLVRYNNLESTGRHPVAMYAGSAIYYGQQGNDATIGPTWIQNNNLRGRIWIHQTGSDDGEVRIEWNNIENGDVATQSPDAGICDGNASGSGQQWGSCGSVSDPSKVLVANNNLGTAGIVDDNGVTEDADTIGVYGFERIEDGGDPEPPAASSGRIGGGGRRLR